MPIHIQNRRKAPKLPTARIKQLAKAVCVGLNLPNAELSIVLTDDATIREINREWRGKDKATDVLSFSQVEAKLPQMNRVMLGDVIISMDTALRQAESIGHSLDEEFKRLLVHGVLHLLGHDHVHGGLQARRMKNEEKRLLTWLKRTAKTTKVKTK
jgi:probable rRNA maturation factor